MDPLSIYVDIFSPLFSLYTLDGSGQVSVILHRISCHPLCRARLNFILTNQASGTSLTSEFTINVENLVNANAGSDQSILCPTVVPLIGNSAGAGTGQWVVVSAPALTTLAFTNPTNPSTNVTGLTEEGIYEFAWEITTPLGGCTSSDIVMIERTCPMPVRLIFFTAKDNGENASLLHWSTASEDNSKGFGMERSAYAKKWHTLDFVTARMRRETAVFSKIMSTQIRILFPA